MYEKQVNTGFISESRIQELIRDNTDVQKYIIDNLGYHYYGTERFVREVQYINGIRVDFKIIQDDRVIALMECKRGDIGVTDYVRGIGQLLQYEYFNEKDIRTGEEYAATFQTVYFIPSDIIKNPNFNIGQFKYPVSTHILEINVENFLVREINSSELEKISQANNSKSAISQYYFRDNRLFELFILLQYLRYLKIRGITNIDRKELEISKLRLLETPNNRNWRNAFITLSTLGFIDRGNKISNAGEFMAIKSYEDFCYEIYNSYAKPYIDLIANVLENNINMSLSELKNKIETKFNGKEVIFLTDSNTRYLSSWLNIMRDDFNCIDFSMRSNERTFLYDIYKVNKETLISNIKNNSMSNKYIKRYNELIAKGEL